MKDIIKYAYENIRHRNLRSWLTILSIVIGIMAIFALVSFGLGVDNYMNKLAEDMGKDKLVIQPAGFLSPGLSSIEFTDDDIRAIEKTKGIIRVAPMFLILTEVKDDPNKKGKWVSVSGMPTDSESVKLIKDTWDIELLNGRELRKQDKYKVSLGYSYSIKDKIFNKAQKVGGKLYIKGTKFDIVGIYDTVGNQQDDSNLYMPLDTAHKIFGKDSYQLIFAQIASNENPEDMVEKVKRSLRRARNLDKGKEDFSVQTFDQVLESFGNILDILNGMLVLIALISVVVSAVNIANSMFTSVLERTNEIGVMKAIGARNSTIQSIFLIESGMLGLVGGIIGVLLGGLIASIGGNIAKEAGYEMLRPIFPIWLILLSLAFAFFVGMFSGYFPSRQASRLKPVDALRYE